MVTWRRVRSSYDRARLRFFMDAEPPLRVPPPAAELRWYWMPRASTYLALTHFDVDGDPDSVGLNVWLAGSWDVLQQYVLHEMVHMRDPRARCGGNPDGRRSYRGRPSRRWLEETARLVALGAPLL